MTQKSDLTVFSNSGKLVLAVECKGGNEVSPESAALFRRNLLVHSLVPSAVFYMLAYPKRVFVWNGQTASDALPDFQAPLESMLLKYAPQLSAPSMLVQESSLAIVLQSWFSDLASGGRRPDPNSPVEHMLVTSGVYDQMLGGSVVFNLKP